MVFVRVWYVRYCTLGLWSILGHRVSRILSYIMIEQPAIQYSGLKGYRCLNTSPCYLSPVIITSCFHTSASRNTRFWGEKENTENRNLGQWKVLRCKSKSRKAAIGNVEQSVRWVGVVMLFILWGILFTFTPLHITLRFYIGNIWGKENNYACTAKLSICSEHLCR